MWKFGSWTRRDRWLFLLTIGVILCIMAFPFEKTERTQFPAETMQKQETEVWNQENASKQESAYERRLEQRVRELLLQVEGVGKVDVMIVLKSSAQKVFHQEGSRSSTHTKEEDSAGGMRDQEILEEEQRAATYSTGGEQGPVIEKELYPEISGIVITASGGGNPAIQAEISAAMEALFGIPAHKIKVLKRVD